MNTSDKERVLRWIDRLGSERIRLSPLDAEEVFLEIFKFLLSTDGYDTTPTPRRHDGGVDLIARRGSYKIAIKYKYREKSAIDVSEVRSLLGAALLQEADKAALAVNTRFTREAKELVSRELPIELELVDIEALKSWVDRLEFRSEARAEEALEILNTASRELALLIAQNPRALDHIEWRDLERVLSEVFAGLGFKVELTPGSKDQGKDIILECLVKGKRCEYIVEVKHWRSGARVGKTSVREFLHVIVREGREGGLFLSTYGYTENAFEKLSEIDRQRLRFGSEEKIFTLARTYTKARSGIWSPPAELPAVLYEGTA